MLPSAIQCIKMRLSNSSKSPYSFLFFISVTNEANGFAEAEEFYTLFFF